MYVFSFTELEAEKVSVEGRARSGEYFHLVISVGRYCHTAPMGSAQLLWDPFTCEDSGVYQHHYKTVR